MRRKPKPAEHEDSTERWLVSYADFITLMFAFFTVLYATSDINIEKSKGFQESIQKYLIRFGAAGGSGDEVNQGVRENSPIQPPIRTYQIGEEETRATLEKAEIFVEEKLMGGKGQKLIQDVVAIENGVRITLAAPLVYAEDSVKFRPDYLEAIDTICDFLKSLGKQVVVESHMDSGRLANTSYPSHWEFAAARASTFVRYLVRRHEFKESSLSAVSYGASRPLFASSDTKNRSKNQRLDLLILTE
ncbi:MAG: OmpA family protein [Bdellovibrionaceae bacterium]|nr:OmpA family protein [Bdellovibrionales bacterium]MCB9085312.1 OmpA family protein [Pseudobdellovibrionaceae bacterium]